MTYGWHQSVCRLSFYVDESGDHNLAKIDAQFPAFVFLFAIIHKESYVNQICPDLQRFKFEFWGHDEVLLHEHEIRKPFGDFLLLIHEPVRVLDRRVQVFVNVG